MKIGIDYRDGKLAAIDVHDPTSIQVNDHRSSSSSSGPYVALTLRAGETRVLVFLPPKLADDLGNALCQLPVLEEA